MNPYLGFGPGDEPAAWLALGLAALGVPLALKARAPGAWARVSRVTQTGVLLPLLAASAALLSAAYIAHYLRGGPRIIDAAYYFLEARALSQGELTFSVPSPLASFNGRFLVANAEGRLGVLFPPGYPAALAPWFWLGAPLALGPVIAALLVAATYRLARALALPAPVALGAAGLSVLSATLRYHSADTMSHGLAALLLATALAGAVRATKGNLVVTGLCLGWLVATRPFTGAVGLLGVLWLARARSLWALPFLAPGLWLLLAHQHALTGRFLGSTQLAYYSVADGPPGCFRYGFGTGIGCLFEHGEFVRARLRDGYGLVEAAANTARRLALHSTDIANAAPLALLVPYAAWRERREPRLLALFGVVLGVVLVYAPFYFEGSYPGGGARFFADALPLEHVLLAQALGGLGWLRWVWAVCLAGFGLHTHQHHALLRDREGGRPMFEDSALRAAGVDHGLVLVSTDHAFALGHDPSPSSRGLVIARHRHDLLDRLLWEGLGRPPTYRYDFSARGSDATPTLVPVNPMEWGQERVEFENLWPPLAITGGFTHPDFSAWACASRGRGLRIQGAGATDASLQDRESANTRLRVALPTPLAAPPHLTSGRLGWIGENPPVLRVVSADFGAQPTWEKAGDGCWRSANVGLKPGGRALELTLRGAGMLDYVELSR